MSYNNEDLLDFICQQTGKTRGEWAIEFKMSGTIPWYFKDDRPSWFPESKWRDGRVRYYSQLAYAHCNRNSSAFKTMKETGLTHHDFPGVQRITQKRVEEKLALKTGIKGPFIETKGNLSETNF